MGVKSTTAEKNRRKHQRKKKEKEEQRRRRRQLEEAADEAGKLPEGNNEAKISSSAVQHQEQDEVDIDIEIEYVAEDPNILPFLNIDGTANNNQELSSDGTKESTNNGAVSKSNNPPSGFLPEGLPPTDGTNGESASQLLQQQQQQRRLAEDNDIVHVLRRFYERALVVPSVSSAVVSDDDKKGGEEENDDDDDSDHHRNSNKRNHRKGSINDDDDSDDDDDDDDSTEKQNRISKRKLKEMIRPTVAELKRRVARPDLVEAHDVTAADPDFLIALKGIPGTAKVPRHWGRKRKYLQGKRGFEKPPFQLPEFIVKTGITEIRDTVAEDEAKKSAKQKNRGRVNPKMGNMDVDYKVLYDAFFKYQTKPTNLTKFGDLYYEGKELQTSTDLKPGGPYSHKFLQALGMAGNDSAPPWLYNMQRYGPPPSYPHLSIPGLNAPLPQGGTYGFHPGGFGKPPVDAFGRPLFGGNPFDPPGSANKEDMIKELVTSDGKTVLKAEWGSLPSGDFFSSGLAPQNDDEDDDDDDESESEEGSSNDEIMQESEGEEEATVATEGMASVLPPPPTAPTTSLGDLRKQPAGDETPAPGEYPPQRLYQVLEAKTVAEGSTAQLERRVFQSDIQYVVPGMESVTKAAPVPEGAESVLSKAMAPGDKTATKRKQHNAEDDGDDEDALDKNFKF